MHGRRCGCAIDPLLSLDHRVGRKNQDMTKRASGRLKRWVASIFGLHGGSLDRSAGYKSLRYLVGLPGFEPGTSCTPSKRASQAAPQPECISLAPHRKFTRRAGKIGSALPSPYGARWNPDLRFLRSADPADVQTRDTPGRP
jgi:hypothetical protein